MAKPNEKRPIVGIDLGTTNSCIAYWNGAKPEAYAIGTPAGTKTVPSVVNYNPKTDEWVVGAVARNKYELDPENTILSIKRHIGDPNYRINIYGNQKTPTEISSIILKKLKESVEKMVPGSEIEAAVISVPYAFNSHEIEATREAGNMAGLKVAGIIHEPTAAALAYGITKEVSASDKLLVFDLGGGTFDITIFDVENTEDKVIVNVCATNGRKQLGGDDFDKLLYDHVLEWFKNEYNIGIFDCGELDDKSKKVLANRVREAAVNAKEYLSEEEETDILFLTGIPGKDVDMALERDEFRESSGDLLEDIGAICEKTFSESKLGTDDIDRIILVGGSTKMPIVKDVIEEVFDKRPEDTVDVSLAVALGAATRCAISQGFAEGTKDIEIRDVVSHAFGVAVGQKPKESFVEIIPKNSQYPIRESKRFTTIKDNQSDFALECYQGEGDSIDSSTHAFIGSVMISGIKPLPRGEPDIHVTFEVDDDGVIAGRVTESHTPGWAMRFSLDPEKTSKVRVDS